MSQQRKKRACCLKLGVTPSPVEAKSVDLLPGASLPLMFVALGRGGPGAAGLQSPVSDHCAPRAAPLSLPEILAQDISRGASHQTSAN